MVVARGRGTLEEITKEVKGYRLLVLRKFTNAKYNIVTTVMAE